MPARSSTSLRRTPVQRALPIAPFAHSPPATRGWKKPREFPEHWLTAAISTRGKDRMSFSDKRQHLVHMAVHGQAEFVDVDRGGDHGPMPADIELIVGREDALIEDFERRFEQRRARTLQNHRALLRKGRGYRSFARTAGQWQLNQRLRQGRPGCERQARRTGVAEQPSPGECVTYLLDLHVYPPCNVGRDQRGLSSLRTGTVREIDRSVQVVAVKF